MSVIPILELTHDQFGSKLRRITIFPLLTSAHLASCLGFSFVKKAQGTGRAAKLAILSGLAFTNVVPVWWYHTPKPPLEGC